MPEVGTYLNQCANSLHPNDELKATTTFLLPEK